MGVTEKDLVDFVYREARLLDEMRYDAWLALFTEDGYYWMPAEWRQTDPVMDPHCCWSYETKAWSDMSFRRASSRGYVVRRG